MARQLYRIYLYTVSIALLVLAAVGLGMLLSTLFAYTPLRGSYRVEPGQRELVQSLVFAVTAWVIAAALGALHLRLIWRDIAEYPEAGRGAVRSFFLNVAEAGGALVVVFTGAGAFSTLAYADPLTGADSTGAFAAAIAALLFVAVVEMERRRFPVAAGAATVFERLHVFGVPLIILVAATLTYWQDAMRTSLAGVLMNAGVYSPLDPNACASQQSGPIEGPCSLPNAGFLWLAVLVPIAAIVLYAVAANNDRRSLIRVITHIGSLSVGVGFVVFGLERGIELLLRGWFGIPVGWSDVAHPWSASYDFIAPLSVGILIAVAFGLWLRAEKADLPTGARITDLLAVAVTSVIFAGVFWWGIGSVAYTALQWFGSSGGESFAEQWATALALTIAGLAYIPLAVYLRLATTEPRYSAPRRGFVLAMLAGGIITSAVGLTITLYTLGTALLGAPLDNWQQTVRAGLAVLLVGVILVVSYGWVALQERSIGALFRRLREATAKPAHIAAPATPAQDHATGVTSEASSIEVTSAIEDVLKDYEAHRISLHEASDRIRTLMRAGVGTPTAHT